ncbi:MAG: Drug resistance transporter EmrB/QacA subfamily [Verrucomicrobiales bacterium]|nr:Drug resistance transporter EmrB/QacA subfamily [Verrucomicrobiales bacterium]
MASPSPSVANWQPAANPWIIAVAVMSATFMEVLDTSVANVSLPHIGGNLSATTEEATWVLTSYLVSNAIILPMTGWLGLYFGRKRLLVICITIFTIASVLCGMAPNLAFLIVARVLQGAGGGAMLPISQAILLESFPPAKRGVAMAVFAMGVVVAPILGPTLGGWITDNYSWRWIFYINLPVGIFAIVMAQAFIEDPPYIRDAKPGRIDLIGFALLSLWLGTLQVVFDKGQQADWFEARWVCWTVVISTVSFISFVWREFWSENPLVNLRILSNRNFTTGLILMTMVAAVLYGTTAAMPIFLQTLMGYPALQSGYAMSPRGFGAFLTTILVGRLIGKVKNRWLIIVGFSLLAFSSFWLGGITLEMGMASVIWPSILNGVAVSFIFVPLTTATMGHLQQQQIANASGIFNLMRNLGGSIGIAGLTTMLARDSQVHQAAMISHLTPFDAAYQQQLGLLQSGFARNQSSIEATLSAQQVVYAHLYQQSQLWAFVDGFRIFGFLCLCCIPVVFIFKKVSPKAAPIAAH